jgi:ubiquinone/menaquinone biosynthesis C-methylase UbiE
MRNRHASLVVLALAAALVTGCADLKRWAYEGFGRRDQWQQPERVIATLAIAPGAHVADVGAGGGYFTFRLADAVGPEGTVFAVDVDAAMLEHIERRARDEGRGNIETILAAADDTRLPANAVDLIFICNTFHHLTDRPGYFARLLPRLRAGGRIAIIDYRPSGWFATLFGHATEAVVITAEVEAAGYAVERQHDFLARQHFFVFVPGKPSARS